jgi:hypothetical protein
VVAFRFSTRNTEVLEEVQQKVFQVMRSASKCKVEKLSDKV